ncbi:Aste57867_105 [Aphanomyces stellatus]|uniref:Aste57867_105 protein n=1 Tax=Aphanomyces stellatus TaxID=120398 RepID=A0A485K6X1_9STRA|nr:hypothetical protein As57867_000105 [Aphanomyces stellatus]VFT77331.1 Aste57867_105 [Aphanomyces stellatus]
MSTDSEASSSPTAETRPRSGTNVPMMRSLTLGEESTVPIYKFVLTGGPCAGKTTSLDRLSSYFRERGFRVYMVPEASTLLQTGGAWFVDLQEHQIMNFQWQILSTQMALEDAFMSLAKDTGSPCVILCDRGAMDGSAYLTPEQWEDLKSAHDLDTVTLRDTRYNAVFHLVTAAKGAEAYYTLSNNNSRYESVEGAIDADNRLCHAWVGHPKLFVFDNSTSFEAKMQRLIATAANLTGLPSTVKTAKKYLLKSIPTSWPIHVEEFEVEKVYLSVLPTTEQGTKDYDFVRCRTQYGLPSYGMTTVRYLEDSDEPVHLKRVLSAREYAYAVRHRKDLARQVIKQRRICFLWKNQSFNIHWYKEPTTIANQGIVHVQAADINTPVEIPSFLDVECELDRSHAFYSAYNIALE